MLTLAVFALRCHLEQTIVTDAPLIITNSSFFGRLSKAFVAFSPICMENCLLLKFKFTLSIQIELRRVEFLVHLPCLPFNSVEINFGILGKSIE